MSDITELDSAIPQSIHLKQFSKLKSDNSKLKQELIKRVNELRELKEESIKGGKASLSVSVDKYKQKCTLLKKMETEHRQSLH